MSAPTEAAVDVALGLSGAEVAARTEAGLTNRTPPGVGRSVRQILAANIFTRFNAILGTLLVVVAFVGPVQDGLFGVVLVVNTAIGVIQEVRAKRALDRLAILTAPMAHVRRDGSTREVPLEEVVLDDAVEVGPGDQVVADGAVLWETGLEVDESLLTGEAERQPKGVGDQVLSGSFVVAGNGCYRATGVGASAYAQQVQVEARRFSLVRSELQQGTNQILRWVTWVMVPAAALLVSSQLWRSHQPTEEALRGMVAGIGAMVPEGLVLLTTIAFALGALRLVRQRVLVQELGAIEGLARVDVLCVDKTGTLTEPGMAVSRVEVLADFAVRDALGALAGADRSPNSTMLAIAAACPAPSGWVAAARVAFSSRRKWSSTTYTGRGTWVLGGPDVVLGDRMTSALADRVKNEAASGRRILLVARTDESVVDELRLPEGLVPAGLVILEERLRPEAGSTVGYLLDQGVAIKVLSGDDPHTVGAIAERVGIPGAGTPFDARDLPDQGAALSSAVERSTVFGRVQPDQKRAIVEALQRAGHVVAMTGDGVNDVAALKQADLGLAMGSGSQSCRSVARMVLLDSSFAAVPAVLGEGRRVIANIDRVAKLFVTKTVYAALLAITLGIATLPYPFYPQHLTVVSSLTIGIPGFFLALAPGAPRARPGFTRRVVRFTVPAGICASSATLAAYAIARGTSGTSVEQAKTAATIALFVFGIWVLVLVARPLTTLRVVLVAAMAAGGVLFLVVGFASRLFSLVAPPLPVLGAVGAVVVGASAVLWGVLRWALTDGSDTVR